MNILNKEKILEQAKLFTDEGKFDKAIREYEKILLVDSTDLRVKLKIAELYTKRKQINDAIHIYREVADSYAAEGFFLKAVTVHKNILRLNPSLIEVNEQLAALYENMGLVTDAVRQYEILVAALELKGMQDRILNIRTRIVKLNPKDVNARIKLAELHQRNGDEKEAIKEYEEAVQLFEGTNAHPIKKADLYEKILVHRPDKEDMFVKLIDIYHDLGDTKKMLKWLEFGKDIVENDPRLLKMLAQIYVSQNQTETARSKYIALAELCRSKGDIDGALEAYFEILVLLPDEEERLGEKIEELKQGVLSELVNRANERRKELEAEEERRLDATEAQKHAPAKPEATYKEKDVKKAQPKFKELDVQRQKKEDLPGFQVQQQKSFSLKEANSSFNLGTVFMKTGLIDEAKTEFEKAKKAYETYIASGGDNASIEDSLSVIEEVLSVKPASKETEPIDSKLEAASSKPSSSSSTKKTSSKPETVKQSDKDPHPKKKISFI